MTSLTLVIPDISIAPDVSLKLLDAKISALCLLLDLSTTECYLQKSFKVSLIRYVNNVKEG